MSGLRTESSESDATGLAFLSFVYPRDRWTVAVYRHVLANVETQAETEGLFGTGTDCCEIRYLDQRNRSTLEIISYGFSAAYRITDTFSLGLGLVYYDTLIEIQSDLYFWDDLDDADELHLGGEWAFLQSKPLLALRAGIWHDPEHQTLANERADDFTRALLQPGEDELHFALGLGAAFESFQIDGAVDISDSVKTLSLSAIYSF